MKIILTSAATAILLLPVVAFGQAEKEIAGPAAATSAPSTMWLPNTLFKLGTGLSRQSGYGSYSGLLLPITLGIEHQFTPKISVYFNLSPMLRANGLGHRPNDLPFLQLSRINADLGARYYYNQAKREQRGRAHGPFVGNYLALQVGSDIYSYRYETYDTRRYYGYDYSHIALLWGMQRRIGQWGLFDGNVGIAATDRRYTTSKLLLELNARISLAH